MKKNWIISAMLCLALLGGTPAMADEKADLFNTMLPEATIKSLMDSNSSKYCEGDVPEALLGNYAGRGDQSVAFSVKKIDVGGQPKTVIVYSWKTSGHGGNSLIVFGKFKADGSDVVYKDDAGKLKIVFDPKGEAFVSYDLPSRTLKTKVTKIN